MNLILLFPDDFLTSNRVYLRDTRRVTHIRQIHRTRVGDQLKVGQVDGNCGTGRIERIDSDGIELGITLDTPPPPASNLSLILGLPRPPMLKRTLQTIATLGVKELLLLQSARVEKSYWQSPQLGEDKILEQLTLGLEQAGDTLLPRIHFAKRFRPFVEDELADHLAGRRALLAHPYTHSPCPTGVNSATVLAIGPEGGFIDREIATLQEAGFKGVTLGPRIMRVETVVPYLLGKLS